MFTGAIPQHTVTTTDKSFQALGLGAPILATLAESGFRNPTPIQAEVIPLALSGRDVIGLAMTGSGKTAAFALPLAQRLWHGRGVRGLILSPTREIALQTQAFLEHFGRSHQLRAACIIGGVRMGPQVDALRGGPDIVVATPGRLLDHVERGNVKLDFIEHLVLDEADHMLDLGFLPQMNRILEKLPTWRQTMMFSALYLRHIAYADRFYQTLPHKKSFEHAVIRFRLSPPKFRVAAVVEPDNFRLSANRHQVPFGFGGQSKVIAAPV